MSKKQTKKIKKLKQNTVNSVLAENRMARYQYEILETLETGIELLGTEVKSIRAGQANLKDGFCLIRNNELQLHNVHISPHRNAGNFFNHEPLRTRKLLAHKKEIKKLKENLQKKGLALIPLNVHLKGSWIKITIAVGRGKKLHDKRQDEKNKLADREAKKAISRY